MLVALLVAVGGTAIGANYLVEIRLKDVQSAGTNVDFTKTTQQPVWNFVGGFAYNADGGHYNVGVSEGITATSPIKEAVSGAYASTISCPSCTIKDVDMGEVVNAPGIMMGSLTARPTCTSSLRGWMYTQWTAGTGDAGVKDVNYQCCKAAAGTYSWVAQTCN